mgnify:CR=1 FL=1
MESNVLNTDLAKDQTLQDIKSKLSFDSSDVTKPTASDMNVPLVDLNEEIQGIVDAPALLGEIPFYAYLTGFGGSSSCSGFSYDAGRWGTISFNKHCDFIDNYGKPALGFLFGVLTISYLAGIYRRETARGF